MKCSLCLDPIPLGEQVVWWSNDGEGMFIQFICQECAAEDHFEEVTNEVHPV